MRIEPELLDDRHVVGNHPLPVDLVADDHAVGDGPRYERPAGGQAQMTVLGVPARTGHQVRGVEPILVVAVPDHLRGHAAALGIAHQPLDGVAHHVLAIVDRPGRAIEDAIVRVVRVDQADIALVPDLVGTAHDVVDDVGVDVVEAVERLAARTIGRRQLRIVSALDLQHLLLGCLDPGDMGGLGALAVVTHENSLEIEMSFGCRSSQLRSRRAASSGWSSVR